MANEYDKILRETFKNPKHNLLKSLLAIETDKILPLPTKVQQTIIEREADTVVEVVPVTGTSFILHVEWQSTNDHQMAFRMAKYDLLLAECYGKKVMGIVIYVGEKTMTMVNSYESFGLQYTCPIIDIRNISSKVFLSSDDPGEVLLAILTGNGDKLELIREILTKLQILTKGDDTVFREKVKHLEIIAQLRGIDLQEQIVKAEVYMPVTLDIRNDIRYLQGREEGVEEGKVKSKVEIGLEMIKIGMNEETIKRLTGFTLDQLKKINR
ncbi:hypothetical protein SAMN05421788_107244 [Filimonas lacunae]|uniref:Transposase (putative) YhgA-like domain-containing protein n=1 Tax=Filimonas lacunae TaxID=477680 RepID=A0A173MG32_9BACT|nr:hypothetical protein [Filimonas lacunae]BAV06582.1 hypothetical protein FLA_2601 [Filimonas lacunae]SIT27470.1 hypothetical protein SAMN05421788_107244 [Filimonas lacunae]